ncbi:MAG: hypothetical protein Q9163_004882 [Psora crenata]
MQVSSDIRQARKRREQDVDVSARKRSRTNARLDQKKDQESEIPLLESRILESRKHYNDIVILLDITRDAQSENKRDILAAVALCRVFCTLMAAGSLSKSKDVSESELTVVRWLIEKLKEFYASLLRHMDGNDVSRQTAALTLIMRLLKEEATHLHVSDHEIWSKNLFSGIIAALLKSATANMVATMFLEQYVEKYDDIRYYFFARVGDIFSSSVSDTQINNALSVLATMQPMPEKTEGFPICFLSPTSKTKKRQDIYSRTSCMKQAQRAWMGIIRQKLTKAQRKGILEAMPVHIAPWFLKTELLMDFLTDSFNVGGSTSLMALAGLFYLIQNKNLDYPQFYLKLYSLLDENILHSKHRSRFFRLLDTFLSSTHLPAALVASFIKRLSRLCLYAPPSGIVVVVPWVYNLLKNHPTCTFMIHRTAELPVAGEGWGDPFRMQEPDPMETDAIESSLWEIETLRSHYHPNVAAIAKIVSEQFTKHAYNIEDFLDHSYATMLDAELSKSLKCAPEIEYHIPKKIFTQPDTNTGNENSLLLKLWGFV